MEVSKDLLKEAVDKWGADAQVEMIIEECAELILALQKLRRYGDSPEKGYLNNVKEELADVYLMVNQGAYIFGEEDIQTFINQKSDRLKERLNK